MTFTLRPTCVDSDRPSFTVPHTTKAEQAAYLASQAETHYPQNAVQFVMQGHSTTELLDVGLTTLSLLPLPVGRLGSLLRGTAGVKVAEQAAGGGATQLFRTVGQAEARDIAAAGAYRNPAGLEGKYFYPTQAQAENLAAKYTKMGLGNQTLTSGQISNGLLRRADAIEPAGEGPAFFIPNELLPHITGVRFLS